MLEQQWVPAKPRIENPDAEAALEADEDDRYRDHRRAQDHDQGRRIRRPDEQRQPEPGEPGARILWIVTMKLSPVSIDEKPVMNIPTAVTITCELA
jgi:hypothetical protein